MCRLFLIAGHGAKPHSPEYLANIQLVDAQIKKFVSVVEKFYAHDGATAYVMTAVTYPLGVFVKGSGWLKLAFKDDKQMLKDVRLVSFFIGVLGSRDD